MKDMLSKNSINLQNCSIFVSLYPCSECAKIIIQLGIKEVVYLTDPKSWKKKNIATKTLFNASYVKVNQHKQVI